MSKLNNSIILVKFVILMEMKQKNLENGLILVPGRMIYGLCMVYCALKVFLIINQKRVY